ncbi:hypothetical protein Tco_0619840 [Tanacetum coccineum]
MPLFPSLEPSVSCIDDLDFFKDFGNEFPAIVYNDALTSKSDFSTEPTLCPQHIDEFDLKDETSLSEYDEEEQNVLYFNDLFPFNIIYLDDLKSDKDNDDNEIDMIQTLRDMAPLPPCDQRHLWLCYHVKGYTEEIDLAERLRMGYTKGDSQEVFVSHAWRRLFEIRAPLFQEFILEFFSTCRIGSEMGIDVADTFCFQLGGARRTGVLIKHSMGPFKGVIRQSLRGVPDAGLTVPAPPQPKQRLTVCEHVMEPSKLSKSRAELRREGVYKSVKAEEKSKLKTC